MWMPHMSPIYYNTLVSDHILVLFLGLDNSILTVFLSVSLLALCITMLVKMRLWLQTWMPRRWSWCDEFMSLVPFRRLVVSLVPTCFFRMIVVENISFVFF
jgi:hypothetical protein